jgi:hypothetical protein
VGSHRFRSIDFGFEFSAPECEAAGGCYLVGAEAVNNNTKCGLDCFEQRSLSPSKRRTLVTATAVALALP